MRNSKAKAVTGLFFRVLVLLAALSQVVTAERLPVHSYTTADGLPVDFINCIKRDSHGFLWFCTQDGLSKFDGYQFTTYGKQHGLPHPNINALIESSDGTYWVATNGGGVCRFNPAVGSPVNSVSRFKAYALEDNPVSNLANCLCEDREGRIWVGTDQGLFYFDQTQDRFIAALPDAKEIYALVADRQGALWIGVENQLWRRSPDGRLARYAFQVGKDLGRIITLLEDDNGKLWAGSWYAGLFELDPKQLPLEDSVLQVAKTTGLLNQYTAAGGAVIGAVVNLYQSSDGHLWIVTRPGHTASLGGGGLFEFDGQAFRRYGKAQGLTSEFLSYLAEDSEGNFWLGSIDGAMKIVRNGFTMFGEADGFRLGANAIFENQAGELCVITEKGMVVSQVRDGRFTSVRFNVPQALANSKFWGTYQITFQDRAGDWWVPTAKGLMRFANVARFEQLARARPTAHYQLEGDRDWFDIFRLFEDARGDIWVSLASRAKNPLVKWERATEKFHYYTEADGVPSLGPPTAFCEDADGNLWIGCYSGGLLRYRDGQFTRFGVEDGVPSGFIKQIYLDRSRRLWVASSSDGVGRIDDTSQARPPFVKYTIADGLSSNVVSSIIEDNWGRFYFTTSRGVDRLNPVTGNIKRYTAADGLPKGGGISFRDASGALWFSGFYELARLIPEPDVEQLPPPVLITGLRVNGETQPIADLGEIAMSGFELAPSQNHIQIEFLGLAFGAGETLQYQYKLVGADADWQPLTTQRSVNYANLAPGAYRFRVRVMNAEGSFSPSEASVDFVILAPIWRRGWFLAIVVALAGLIAYTLYRYRVGRFLEIERVRTRIASDLHDDIGSNLTKIAILSEVAQHQFGREGTDGDPLSSVARISRESLDSMGDIVWAINPKRDTLRELLRRMRGFATDIFTSRNIEFSFHHPDHNLDLKLGPDVRRDVLLIFKETINNAVRHSGCTKAEIELKIVGASLMLRVSDDGKGFDAAETGEGNGLVSMRRRAESLHGKLTIGSTAGQGTSVILWAPISRRPVALAKTN
jgi:ligand-binding sensor domain-containing protein/signal transduction histidine kinase